MKITIRCPDCGKIIYEFNPKELKVHDIEHKCSGHYFFVNLEIEVSK